jgi:hypothetical protein
LLAVPQKVASLVSSDNNHQRATTGQVFIMCT